MKEQVAPPPSDPPPRLLGVIIGCTGAIAVMQDGDAQPVRVRVQDEVEGWMVTRIEAKRVVLHPGDQVAVVRMDTAAEYRSPANGPPMAQHVGRQPPEVDGGGGAM